jgi:ABC-type transport system involved in multi-copper enzyme maturation permease subunit
MWRIAATESRMLWRRGLFRWAGGVLLALLSISLLLALDNYHRRSVAAEFATGAQRDQWLHKHIVNPHVAAHAGTVLFRPLDSLTVLDSGVDPFLGTSVFLEAHRRSMLAHPSAQRVPAAGRFAELTAAITLQTLVPLLIVLLTTPAFAGEREHGTLRHLLSLGVSARAVLLGKAAGVTAPILGLVFPLMLMGVVAVSINAPLDALRAMLLAVAYVLYVFVWIGLGLGISVRSRSSHSALAAALALWIVGCFIQLEWRLLRSTRTVWIVLAAGVAAALIATAVGLSERKALQRAADDAGRARQNQPTTFRAALPPLPSAVLSTGRADVLPQRYAYRGGAGERFSPFERTVGIRMISGLFPERPTENPSGLVLGSFDLAFVVIYVFPVLVLSLNYNIVSDDRDSGVLALVLAQPVSFGRLLAAKAAVRAAGLVPLIAAPAIVVLAASGSAARADVVARIVIWMAVVEAYLSMWMALAVLVNTRGYPSSLNASILISTWLVVVVVVPAIVNLTARTLVSPESMFEFTVAERAASLDINPRIDAMRAARPQPLVAATRRALFEDRLTPLLIRLDAEERRQQRVSAMGSVLSPALLVQVVFDELAGTSLGRWRRFLSQLDSYIRTVDVETRMAPFTFREEGTGETLRRLLFPLLALTTVAATAMTAAFRLSRYSARY